MLIGRGSKRPSLESVRRIKRVLNEVLRPCEDSLVTVTQLACLEKDCVPLETVIGFLRPDEPQLQFKIYKETNSIDARDLEAVCLEWGFEVSIAVIDSFFHLHQES